MVILAVLGGCDTRRPVRRSASTASGGQRGSAPFRTAKITVFYAHLLSYGGTLNGSPRG